MPANGMFDLITEIFFGNANEGGEYTATGYFQSVGGSLKKDTRTIKIEPDEV
jgi:hypothetical protein